MFCSRHRRGKILILHRIRSLGHRRLHETLAPTRDTIITTRQFDDAEELISQAWEFPAQEPCRILQPPLTPHPAMPLQRQAQAQHRRTCEKDAASQPGGRVKKAIQREDNYIRKRQPKRCSQHAFRQFDEPNPPTKIRQLCFQHRGKRKRCIHIRNGQ